MDREVSNADVLRHAAAKFGHGRVSRIREAVATKNLNQRFCQDAEIERETLVVDVPEIVGEFPLPIEAVASVHLRPAGDSGADVVTAHLFRRVAAEICSEQRTRPDQAHLAAEHVDQLGKFVQAAAAQKVSEAGPALVVWK